MNHQYLFFVIQHVGIYCESIVSAPEASYRVAASKERRRSLTLFSTALQISSIQSTFILEHLVCLFLTASVGRSRGVRAKPQVGTRKIKKVY